MNGWQDEADISEQIRMAKEFLFREQIFKRAFNARAYGFATPPPVPTPDAYAVLGLPHSATRAMLNKRHRQLAREHRDNDAKLREINASYNELKSLL